MSSSVRRFRAWLWWLIPFAALALLLGIETDWGRGLQRLPGPAPAIEPKPIATALLPEYRLEGGLGAHTETVSRTLFNPTRRPAPTPAVEAARTVMPKGKFVLTGTAVAGNSHIAFLKEVASGKSRVVRQGEQINGVLVAAVAVDRVKFTQGEDSEELILKTFVAPKSPPPPTPSAPPATKEAGAVLPGAVPPAAPPDPEDNPSRARPPLRAGQPGNPMPAPVQVPAAPATPAAAPAPAAAQGVPASVDPGWNDTFERMRQRSRQ